MTDTATTNATEAPSVVIERTLPAPVNLVWQMWTQGEHFAAWYGPMGATIPTAEIDLSVGGARKICMAMQTPDGPMEMWFVGEHLEIVDGERLVYTESMADPDGNVIPPSAMGMPEGHPETTQIVVELKPSDDGGTHMRMTHVGIPAGSPGEGGWNMAFDKLEAHLGS